MPHPAFVGSELDHRRETLLIDEGTHSLVEGQVGCQPIDQITPKGFARPVQVYRVDDFFSEEQRKRRRRLSRTGERVEVSVIDGSDIRAAILELRQIQEDLEKQYGDG